MHQVTPSPEPLAANAARTPSTWPALASLSLAMLLSSLGTSIANVALPTLAEAFHASFPEVQWVVRAPRRPPPTAVVGAGRLGDLIGRRRLLVAGILGFALASLACGLAPTLPLLVAARGVQGLAGAVMMALTMAMVGEVVPKHRTGSAMGVLGTMSAVGTALGPSLGGAMIAAFGWRSIFLANLPLGLLASLFVVRNLRREVPRERFAGARFDLPGTLVLALTLAAYALAMTLGRGHFGALSLVLLAAAIAGAALFVHIERNATAPLVPLAACREPALRAGLATSLIVATVMMATLVVGPFHLSQALGLDTAQVGFAMSVGPVTAALGGLPAGRLVDRIGAPRITFLGLAALAIGSGALAILPPSAGLVGYLLPIVLATAGYSLFQAANNTAILADVGAERRGVVSGLLHLSRNLGLVTGASFLGAVFAAASGAGEGAARPAAAVADGTRATFAVAAVLLVVALAVARRARASARREQDLPAGLPLAPGSRS